MSKVREYIMEILQREYSFKKDDNIDSIDYIGGGYMDSLGILRFIGQIEDEFSIEFSDEELKSESFRIVGELINMIEMKLEVSE